MPYHLDERLDVFDLGLPVDHEVTARLPAGTPWERMAVLYEQVARTVAAQDSPSVVISGDCTTSLGVLAGLQRAGHDIGIVWFDAHADFHTERTSTSGYLGGMPLALAVGVGTLTLPTALGLRPVAETRTVLIDARDTDPGERAGARNHDSDQDSKFEELRMATTKPRPLAIVTGASRGIGYELAWQFAEHGYDLIIAAEDAAINDAASHLADGSRWRRCRWTSRPRTASSGYISRSIGMASQLDALALNAGIGMGGHFATGTDLAQELKLVD